MLIECIRYKPINHGHFQGYADFFFPDIGIEIHCCTLHKKDKRRWINLPVRADLRKDGTYNFSPIVRFRDQQCFRKFCEEAKVSIDKFVEEQKQKKGLNDE